MIKFKMGDKVRLTKEFLEEFILHTVEMNDGTIEYPNVEHAEEFGECWGYVIGNAHPNWPEIDVRWQPSNFRYCYAEDHLELVEIVDEVE
mgnify:CR=1 FL=1